MINLGKDVNRDITKGDSLGDGGNIVDIIFYQLECNDKKKVIQFKTTTIVGLHHFLI